MLVRRAIQAVLAMAALIAADPSVACRMSDAEQAWVEGSLSAWRYMADERLELARSEPPTIVVFDSKCRFEAKATARPKWRAEPHTGSILIPDGNKVPAQVTSFAGHDEKTDTSFFVMALPSVWQAARIPISGDLKGLTGVFLHEFSHVRQIAPLEAVFAAANAKRKMDENTSDDSLQERFKSDPAYVAVFEKERDLLFRAAAEPDSSKARALAAQALALTEARQRRWFVGNDAYWKNYDDLFVTMEGFGQWVAYSWLADLRGGALGPEAASEKIRGSRSWWSQEQGLALWLVIDRFVPDWPVRAFAKEPALGIDLLRIAAAQPAKTSAAKATPST